MPPVLGRSQTKVKRKIRRYPTGYAFPIDDEWRALIERSMATHEPPLSRTDLAVAVGCDPGTVTAILTPGYHQHTSRLVPAVHNALGLPPPVMASSLPMDPRRAEIEDLLDLLLDLPDEDLPKAVKLVRAAVEESKARRLK